jgi:hypothetical protein
VTFQHQIGSNHPTKSYCLTINFSKHDVAGSNDSDSIRQKVSLGHKVNTGQVGESRGPDLASVGFGCAVRDQVNTKLALGRLNNRIRLLRGSMGI